MNFDFCLPQSIPLTVVSFSQAYKSYSSSLSVNGGKKRCTNTKKAQRCILENIFLGQWAMIKMALRHLLYFSITQGNLHHFWLSNISRPTLL